ncbi:hypothetical protein ACPB8Q_05600 [Methanocaldococcus indicus]|uniref:hypothetical protein n=1 Tax=Methanocaldococcus indicus TaxID=213231 RepID=UPI003C6CFF9C
MIEFNNHITVGIALNNSPGYYYSYNNKHYYYIETTSQGWKIGDIPEEYLNKKSKIFVISYNKPLYVWDCKAYLYTERNYKFVKFVFKIKNFGNRTGKFKVYATFDIGNGYVYNPKESDFITLKPNEERTITLEIPVPNKPYKKLLLCLLDENNSLIDIKYFLEGDYG